MKIQDAMNLDVTRAPKEDLIKANKILTRALNRQLRGFKYGSTKNVDTTKAAFFRDFMAKHGGKTTFGLDLKRKIMKGSPRFTLNQMRAHVSEAQDWLRRKDSSVRKWKQLLNNPPKVIQQNKDLNKFYKKLSIDDKNLFWRWFTKASKSLVYYDSDRLMTAIDIVMTNPSNLKSDAETLDLIKKIYNDLEQEIKKKNVPFKSH